ncbi:PQQ-dependent sugar dehydrogenase [Enterovibrio norvegicus]|uniref:PQQ-dependent sugar dehydrogenase n=1 Tax=Enterovibrio norvegicus TaxID=188144 RepID=UPI000C8451DB|nr:PQQ-dependent sugar dehydrogenase [Enterovibrio norvegicus]PML80343.1 glucose dehydrogenase [Enterovibrio norvegicus]
MACLSRLLSHAHYFSFLSLWLLAAPTNADTVNTQKHTLNIDVFAKGLNHPWSMVFLPEGDILVSERNGALKRVSDKGDVSHVSGLPEGLVYKGQGGLLGLALSPDFSTNKIVYLAFSEEGQFSKAGTSVIRAKLQGNALSDIITIFQTAPRFAGGRHFGGRLLTTDKHLYIALGDRGNRDKAQHLDSHIGSVIRLNLDGSTPIDNPFYAQSSATSDGIKPEIFSYGHRNIQGMTLDPKTNTLWTHEHGPQGGDEVNTIEAGANYGWPTITYGVNYGTGSKIGKGTHAEGMEQPLHFWVPSIAPSGLTIVQGDTFPEWQGDLLLGSLKFGLLVRLDIENGVIVNEERMLDGKYGRIRDVVEGPGGKVYLLTDASNGQILRLHPTQ